MVRGNAMATEDQNQLGKMIDDARNRHKHGVRALAREMNVTHGYVRDIIRGNRVPSEKVIRDLCRVLPLEYDEMMTLAGRVGDSVHRRARSSMRYGQFIRMLADSEVTDEEIDRLTRHFGQIRSRPNSSDSDDSTRRFEEEAKQGKFL